MASGIWAEEFDEVSPGRYTASIVTWGVAPGRGRHLLAGPVFNLNLRNGMTYEQAAANTFTGRQCAKYGLTVVKVDPGKLRGEYGHYTNVEPEFSRP